jgi:nicotinate phosphoribosyltransferase
MPGGLQTDLYELNMAVSYLRRGMTSLATFSLFARRLPPGRGFLIAAGLEDCMTFLEQHAFTEADLAWLARSQGFGERDLAALRRLRFTGDVWAVPEGPRCSPASRCSRSPRPLPRHNWLRPCC